MFSLPTLNRSHWINWVIKKHGNITQNNLKIIIYSIFRF